MPRKDIPSSSLKVKYRWQLGAIMWKFHRWSGVLLGIFFILHIFLMSGMFPFLEFIKAPSHIAGVAALFILHTLNGLRIMSMEFLSSVEKGNFIKHLLLTLALVGAIVLAFIFMGGYIPIIIDEYFGFLKGAN